MTAPRDLGPDFREWMHAVPSMADDLTERTLQQTRTTRQGRRWLWFLPGPRPDQQAPRRTIGPTPWLAMDAGARGFAPATIRATSTQLSATRVLGLVVVIAVVGGGLLMARPLGMGRAPAGQATMIDAARAITGVHGVLDVTSDQSAATERADWGMALMDRQLQIVLEMDDPRLRGSGAMRLSEYNIKGLSRGPTTATFYIQNDEGSWTGDSRGYRGPEDAGYHFQLQLTGHDGYQGLTAILTGDQAFYGDDLRFSGVIVDGGSPPIPGPAEDVVVE